MPRRFCFTPAALLGFTLRSFLLPQGIRHVSGRKHPLTVFPAVVPDAEALGRPDRPRFLGFDPCWSPWRPQACLAPRPLDAPMGLPLPGSARGSLDQDFARPPLTRFAARPTNRPDHRRHRVSIGSRLATPFRCSKLHRVGRSDPRRVFAPDDPHHSSARPPGLWVHLMLRRASLPAVQQSLSGSMRPT
jgi:hypothetical protein